MYIESAASNLTQQGAAIREASLVYGGAEGGGIGHSVCKYKYQPTKDGKGLYACWLHEGERRKRVEKEGGPRPYEVDVEAVFWGGRVKKEVEDGKDAAGANGGGGNDTTDK
mmetsp:Transcript_6008/g.11386  ORF Transcript_6008/g.11386 Transcript_6008/m.11386 type:complete len:111 (+) Transcript_6008:413-745(+)